MLKSLYSGISGLQAHQVAMDVEGNNIANVNTVGFKYSRANFADMLSQTKQLATGPQGGLGGQNDLSVGLGAQISSTTKIFLQGSMQSTDRATDLALQGDGFFVVSPDGGVTQAFTRAGDFSFDADGNMVDNNGYIVQGWTKDITGGDSNCDDELSILQVDSTGPVGDINIEPGLVMPAKKSSEITLNANLNTGNTIESKECIRQLDSSSSTVAGTGDSGFYYQYDTSGTIKEYEENFGVLFDDSGSAFNLSEGQGMWVSYMSATVTTGSIASTGTITLNDTTITITDASASGVATAINAESANTGVTAVANADGTVTLTNLNDDTEATEKNIRITSSTVSGIGTTDSTVRDSSGIGSAFTAFYYTYTDNNVSITDSTTASTMGVNFQTTEDLRRQMQLHANYVKNGEFSDSTSSVSVKVNSSGRFEIINAADTDTATSTSLNLSVTNFTGTDSSSTVSANTLFTTTFSALNTTLTEGSGASASTTAVYAAKHASSIDVFDSLGSTHTVQFEFRKTDENTWTWRAIVPEPGKLVGHPVNLNNESIKENVYEGGTITFNNDGSLKGYNPPTLNYDPGNGAKAPQLIRLDWGKANTFNGLTSLDKKSTTSAISQNGYSAGNLNGLKVDSTGTILGSFDNGRSAALGQVAVAKFANNEGLRSEGDNLYTVSANSGEATIGVASAGGRGEVAAANLEMSNVDLSRSLTQLIVVQRGFQANSKTITTSDTLLNELLQLKR